MKHSYNETYSGKNLERVAFPLGGIGAGMLCIEGRGGISNISLRHRPEIFNDPLVFSAVSFPGSSWPARVIAGPVSDWKIQFPWNNASGNGGSGRDFGLPRFSNAEFCGRFPFARIRFRDDSLPVDVELEAWSPFVPGNADDSSLPAAALSYTFRNRTSERLDLVYSFNSGNFMRSGDAQSRVRRVERGFILEQDAGEKKNADYGAFSARLASGGNGTADDSILAINPAWFRGGWFDSLMTLWRDIEEGAMIDRPAHHDSAPSSGGSLSTRLTLDPGGARTVTLLLSWYVPYSEVRQGRQDECCSDDGCCSDDTCCVDDDCRDDDNGCYRPWYVSRFESIEAVSEYWNAEHERLHTESKLFSDTLFSSTLPPEVLEAVTANLSILKSPTVLRQKDGRLWAYEGCSDTKGCCHGSCTHVWNYAQAIAHLFPDLERTLRESEFRVSQDESGHQTFRTPIPIAPPAHDFHAAADGQLGGIIKLYREWRISADTEWMASLWPYARQSLDYCIATWDPDHTGLVTEPHHNTYDIEFWGPDGMCTSIYLAALEAGVRMGSALNHDVEEYRLILESGHEAFESKLFNGEYFIQDVRWKGLHAGDPTEERNLPRKQYDSPESLALLNAEGPKYQYGDGCLSDGVIGIWFGLVSGIDDVVDASKIASHLRSVHRYNLKADLSTHANPQRPTYALGHEGGLLLCTWPKGNMPTLPFVYSNEVWTGIEYQVASHLIMSGYATEGLEIVRACRDRYDGRTRNPFDEYECGHWYARALSSYSLLQAIGGARYDAVEKVLYVRPNLPGDLRFFFAAETGYGSVVIENGKARFDAVRGEIEIDRIEYRPFEFV